MHTIPYRRAHLRGLTARGPVAEIFGCGPAELARRLFDSLLAWQERAAQRRALARLDDRLLKDVGLTRADVTIETAKPFWRV